MIANVPLQGAQVIGGYAESTEEGNVQLDGAAGSFGGGIIGGVVVGTAAGFVDG